MKRRDPLGWFAYELGKPASEWRLKHWAAMIGVVAFGALILLAPR